MKATPVVTAFLLLSALAVPVSAQDDEELERVIQNNEKLRREVTELDEALNEAIDAGQPDVADEINRKLREKEAELERSRLRRSNLMYDRELENSLEGYDQPFFSRVRILAASVWILYDDNLDFEEDVGMGLRLSGPIVPGFWVTLTGRLMEPSSPTQGELTISTMMAGISYIQTVDPERNYALEAGASLGFTEFRHLKTLPTSRGQVLSMEVAGSYRPHPKLRFKFGLLYDVLWTDLLGSTDRSDHVGSYVSVEFGF